MIYDLLLPSLLNIRFGTPGSNIISIFSYLFAVVSIIANIFLVAKVLNILFKIEKCSEDKLESTHLKSIFKSWLALRENLKEEISKIRRFTPELTTIADILTCFCVVFFWTNGILQLIPIILLKGFVVGLIFKNPFKSKVEYLVTLVNEGSILICLIGLFLSESTQARLVPRQNIYGWTLIISVILTIGFNLCIALYELYSDWKDKKSKKNQN
jgi:hypothetical protein